VRSGTVTRRSVDPASPVLLTKNGPLRTCSHSTVEGLFFRLSYALAHEKRKTFYPKVHTKKRKKNEKRFLFFRFFLSGEATLVSDPFKV